MDQFTVLNGDTIYVVLYEKWGVAPVNNDSNSANIVTKYDASSSNRYGYTAASARAAGYKCNDAFIQWGIGTFTAVIQGAKSTLVANTVLISAVTTVLF